MAGHLLDKFLPKPSLIQATRQFRTFNMSLVKVGAVAANVAYIGPTFRPNTRCWLRSIRVFNWVQDATGVIGTERQSISFGPAIVAGNPPLFSTGSDMDFSLSNCINRPGYITLYCEPTAGQQWRVDFDTEQIPVYPGFNYSMEIITGNALIAGQSSISQYTIAFENY